MAATTSAALIATGFAATLAQAREQRKKAKEAEREERKEERRATLAEDEQQRRADLAERVRRQRTMGGQGFSSTIRTGPLGLQQQNPLLGA